jgi:hypothetical protein
MGFTSGSGLAMAPHQQTVDLQAAVLRTHYKFTEHLIKRPYVYKVLHHPEQVAEEDARGAAECLQAGLLWPIALPPHSRHKRLIPYLFLWSQNMLCVVLLLRLSRQHQMLIRVREQFCDPNFDMQATQTEQLYIGWIRDLSGVDPIAAWCLGVVGAL